MAKKNNTEFEPGCIYQLEFGIDGEWYPFYVGETTEPVRRLREHQTSGRRATDHSTLVYRTIRDLDSNCVPWRMEILEQYGSEGPRDLEDEHIMRLLWSGAVLTNEKKGNAQWMSQRLREAADMRKRGISSYRQYRDVITQEAANRRHQTWMANTAHQPAEAVFVMNQVRATVSEIAAERAEKQRLRQQRAEKREQRRLAAVAERQQRQAQIWEKGTEHE